MFHNCLETIKRVNDGNVPNYSDDHYDELLESALRASDSDTNSDTRASAHARLQTLEDTAAESTSENAAISYLASDDEQDRELTTDDPRRVEDIGRELSVPADDQVRVDEPAIAQPAAETIRADKIAREQTTTTATVPTVPVMTAMIPANFAPATVDMSTVEGSRALFNVVRMGQYPVLDALTGRANMSENQIRRAKDHFRSFDQSKVPPINSGIITILRYLEELEAKCELLAGLEQTQDGLSVPALAITCLHLWPKGAYNLVAAENWHEVRRQVCDMCFGLTLRDVANQAWSAWTPAAAASAQEYIRVRAWLAWMADCEYPMRVFLSAMDAFLETDAATRAMRTGLDDAHPTATLIPRWGMTVHDEFDRARAKRAQASVRQPQPQRQNTQVARADGVVTQPRRRRGGAANRGPYVPNELMDVFREAQRFATTNVSYNRTQPNLEISALEKSARL
ncbi:hypothetical protein CJU90_3621 [Yarrowia sp. C11]|nr:hypothetical protein CJU90_3621 [Yarrowia sp. C11]